MNTNALNATSHPMAANRSHRLPRARVRRAGWAIALAVVTAILPGCSSLGSFAPIPSVPINRVPQAFFGRSKEAMVKTSKLRLRQTPPEVYQLGAGDVLGIWVENVLGDPEEAPPVHFPEDASQQPSIGFPIPVREDGTIALPLVDPIPVDGLTINQATEAIRKAYTVDRQILQPGSDRIIVTLMRRREYGVLVIREDSGSRTEGGESLKRGTGYTIELPAYENDLLHALNETGGLPGTAAKNEAIIFRAGEPGTSATYDSMIAQLGGGVGPYGAQIPLPNNPNATRIPLRFYPDHPPQFTEADIILHEGDIVYIPSREREKFYTGGVLGGGVHLLPRDYDLTILQAIAMAGGSLGRSGSGLQSIGGRGRYGGGGQSGSAPIPPSKAVVIRKVPGVGEIPIRVNLNAALTDPSQRLLIMPEDIIIVQYTCCEEIANAALSMVRFNFLYGLGRNAFN